MTGFFGRSVSLCLILALGFEPLVVLAQDPPPSVDEAEAGEASPEMDLSPAAQTNATLTQKIFEPLMGEGASLEKDLLTQIRRAKHPGTPGTPAGIPSAQDFKRLQARLLGWKNRVEPELALSDRPQRDGRRYLSILDKERAVNLFFTLAKSVIVMNLALGRVHREEAWLRQWRLQVPEPVFYRLPGIFLATDDKTGDFYYPVLGEKNATGVSIRLSRSTVEGMELAFLGEDPNSGNFLVLIKYLALHQLYDSLTGLKFHRRDLKIRWPEVPESLRKMHPIFEHGGESRAEKEVALIDAGFRGLVSRQFDARAPKVLTVPREFCDALARRILEEDAASEASGIGTLICTSLQEAEKEELSRRFYDTLERFMSRLAPLDDGQLQWTLQSVLSSVRVKLIIDKLQSMHQTRVLFLPNEIRMGIMEEIDAWRDRLGAGMGDAPMREWIAAIRLGTAGLPAFMRSALIAQLMTQAKALDPFIGPDPGNARVEVDVLSKSLDGRIQSLGAMDVTRQWIDEIAGAETYPLAQARYAEIIAAQTYPGAVRDGVVDPVLVKIYLDVTNLRRDIDELKDGNPALSDFLTDQAEDGVRKSVRDLVQYGEWMGFHLRLAKENPLVRDLVKDSKTLHAGPFTSWLDDYKDAAKTKVLSAFPMLTATVKGTSGGRSVNVALHTELLRIAPDGKATPARIAAAQTALDQALDETEKHLLESIGLVAEADEPEDLENVITSSSMLELVMGGHSEFKKEQEAYVERLTTPTLGGQIMRRHVRWITTYGFLALLALHAGKYLSKSLAPYLGAIEMSFKPILQGYMTTATALMVAETAYELNHLLHERRRARQRELLFLTNVEGASMISYGEREQAQGAYHVALWVFIGRVAFDGLTAYAPELTRLGAKLVYSRFAKDCQAFSDLGLMAGDWHLLQQAIERVRITASRRSAAEVARAESAYERLHDRLDSGEAWDLVSVKVPKPLSPVDQKIRKAMVRLGKVAP